jgi:hypothetical protein
MYCASCGTQLTQGLSYCNRCGANLKERTEASTASVAAFLAAITLLGLIGLGIMLGGALALKDEGFNQDFIGFFVFFTFLFVSMTELMLFRNLSRLSAPKEKSKRSLPPPVHQELRLPQSSTIGEPVPSVTENTTRTLEHSRREQ